MRIVFDDGTLLLEGAPETVPYSEWDDRVDEYRTHAHRYRDLLNWAGERNREGQATLETTTQTVSAVEDAACAYREFHLSPAVTIEPREYQQAALTAWMDHDRRGSVVLPTGSGKTFLGIQAIADAGVSTLVVVPTIDLMNQWHATLSNAFGDQLPDGVGVLGGGSHNVTDLTVTTYDSAYRYINEYGDRFGLLIVDTFTNYTESDDDFMQTLRKVYSNTTDAGALTYLLFATNDIDDLTRTEREAIHMADVVLQANIRVAGDDIDTRLEVLKMRGEEFPDEIIKLNVGEKLSVDTTRDIA